LELLKRQNIGREADVPAFINLYVPIVNKTNLTENSVLIGNESMVTFGGLMRTIKITRNPYTALSLKFSYGRKSITFRNGFKFQLVWSQFRTLRDHYSLIREYTIEQVEDDLFKIKNKKSEVTCCSQLMPIVCDLMQHYTIQQMENDLFKIKNEKLELIGSSAMLGCIQEQETGEYDCDCRGKVVLDVGGYQGETAVFFSGIGAKKVIIYEPVSAHHSLIRKNVSLNHVNAEIHEEGIGEKNGTITVGYKETDTGFGPACEGQHSMKIKVKNVADVIAESRADVAKFDCEGAEESLVRVPARILVGIESYIVEVHSPEIRKAVIGKFEASGFKLVRETVKTRQISVIMLKRSSTQDT